MSLADQRREYQASTLDRGGLYDSQAFTSFRYSWDRLSLGVNWRYLSSIEDAAAADGETTRTYVTNSGSDSVPVVGNGFTGVISMTRLTMSPFWKIGSSPVNATTLVRLTAAFTDTFERTCRGQALDVNCRGRADFTSKITLEDHFRADTRLGFIAIDDMVNCLLQDGIPLFHKFV